MKDPHPANYICAFIALLFMLLISISPQSRAGDFTVLAGVAKFNQPHDGIYWNKNQPHDHRMNTPVFGLRYDTGRKWDVYSFGVQYTHFGNVQMDSMAVTKDAPDDGGYIPNTGTCVGTCAPLARWRMNTWTESISFIGTRHWGAWSVDVGLNLYETKTRGYVNYGDTSTFLYANTNHTDVGPMFGVTYRNGVWSLRWQLWRMEGRAITGASHSAPAAFNENYQTTLLVGRTF